MTMLSRFLAPSAVLAAALLIPAPAEAQQFVANQIENLISSENATVEIEGLSGALSGAVRIEQLTVSDPDGIYLTATDLALDWSPLALARARVEIQRLTAASITLDRLPGSAPPDPDAEPSTGGFSLPSITANIGEIAVGEFVLGEAVAGVPARLSANASLALESEPTRLEVSADIERLDQPGQIDLSLAYAPDEDLITVEVNASEPAGGIVAGLLELPGAPPVSLTVSGEGPLTAFNAAGSLDIDGEEAISLTASVSDMADGRRVSAEISTITGPFVPDQYVDVVGERADLDIDVLLAEGGMIVVDEGRLVSGNLQLTAVGAYDPTGTGNDLRVTIATEEGNPVPIGFGTSGSRTSLEISALDATLRGSLEAAAIEAAATLRTAGFEDYVANALTATLSTPGFNLNALQGPFSVEANAESVAAPQGVAANVLDGPVSIAAEGTLGADSLTLQSSSVSTGVANAAVSGSAALNFSTFDLALTSDFETAALAEAAVPYAGPRIAFSGAVSRTAEGNLAAENLTVESEGLSINGSASLTAEEITADISGNLDQEANPETAFSGEAAFQLTASGPLSAPAVDLTLTAADLLVGGRELSDLDASIQGTFAPDAPNGQIAATGTYNQQPLQVSADFETLAEGARALRNLLILQGENRLEGEVVLNAQNVPVGNLAIDVPDLATLAALAGQEASGDIAGTVALSVGALDAPVADVALTSGSIAVAGNTLSGTAIDVVVTDYLLQPVAAGTIAASSLEGAPVAIEALDITLTDRDDRTGIEAGVTVNAVPIALAGEVQPLETGVRLALAELTAEIEDAAIALQAPATIEIGGGVTNLGEIALTVGEGSLNAAGTIGEGIELDVTLDAFPLAVANPFAEGLDASGTIAGTLLVEGSSDNPRADFDLAASDLETSQTRAAGLQAVDAVLLGELRNGVTTLETARIDLDEGSIDVTGDIGETLELDLALTALPVSLANGFVEGLDASGTISGTATATGPIDNPVVEFDVDGRDITAPRVAASGIEPLTVDVTGALRNGTVRFEEALVDIGDGEIRATGSVGRDLDLDLDLVAVPAGIANGFVEGLEASGTISGNATATGSIADPDARFSLSSADLSALPLRESGVETVSLDLAGAYAGGTLTLETATIDAGDGRLEASGTVGEALDLQLVLDALPVALANAVVTDLGAEGTLSGTVAAMGSLDEPSATFNVAASGVSVAQTRAANVPPVDAVAQGSYAEGVATIETANLDVGTGSLAASGTVGEMLDLRVEIDQLPLGLADGFVEDLGAQGTISGTATASGALANPSAEFDLTADGVSIARTRAASVPPLNAVAAGTYADGSATLRSADVQVGTGTLSASGTVGQQLDVQVLIESLPLALANGFAPDLGIEGTLSGNVSATGALVDPSAEFDVSASGVSVAQTRAAGVAPLSAVARGTYANGSATLEAANVDVGTGSLAASGTVGQTLDLDVTIEQLPLALANGFAPDLGAQGTLSGTATASGDVTNPTAEFDISASGVSVAQTRAAGLGPISAVAAGAYAEGGGQIRTARIDLPGGGTITATGTVGPELDVDVTLAGIPASLGAAFAPDLAPAGTIAGTVQAQGPVTDPTVTFDISASGLSVAPTRDAGVGALDISLDGTFADQIVNLDALALTGSGLDFSASGSVNVAGTPSFDLSLNGTAPLSVANAILAEGGRSVDGTLTVDAQISGTAAAPNVVGTVSTSGARFIDTGANVVVNNITTTIALSGQTATFQSFSAELGAGGTISVGGTIGLTGGFPADLTITVEDGRYADGELVSTTLDASLTLTGPVTGDAVLAGTIDAEEINITVPENLPSSLARIDVTHVNAPPAVYRQQQEIDPPSESGGTSSGGISLDLTLNAPNRVFVRGRGLDLELGGSIRIVGPISNVGITGAFELQRGRFEILTRRLDFERASLTFSGNLVPTLDLVAASQADSVTVRIAITGPANDPSFSFTSTPALPQDEVLARLIFGQATTDLSPLQIAQLASAAAQLAGVGGSTGLLENLRSQLGVDDLDIRTTADGQAAVGVGRYINENTYVGVDSTGRVSIDLELGANIRARGAVTANGGGEVGIFYEREY